VQAHELRKRYIDYFTDQDHHHVPSSSLVPNDPTLLFTSAGMVQFKEIFWGRVLPNFPRVTTCQKCFRTTDIENVGRTAYHHTFFEMLGNFSFGNYFKKEAIKFAWQFLTGELSISRESLWVSVYEEDKEAFEIWEDEIGIPVERIVRLGKHHNWWGPVGKTGPCGPDTEIFFDAGEEKACGPDCKGLACDCDRFSEIWNLVFMQYDVQEDGSLVTLEKKNIDTGMGLERTTAVLEGVQSDFDIDLFAPITEAIKVAMRRELNSSNDLLHRNVIADHIRGILFLIADGVLPSNEKQGYVLRRILRRAIRSSEKLDLPQGTLCALVDPVIETLGTIYPEIETARVLAQRVISHEECTFRKTLHAGELRLERILEQLKGDYSSLLPGELAFELYDTYGFPVEMTEEILSESMVRLDKDGFKNAMDEQRKRSRNKTSGSSFAQQQAAVKAPPSVFLGYDLLDAKGKIVHKAQEEGKTLLLAFDRTPFYSESGGQVADIGTIENTSRLGVGVVMEVQKTSSGIFLHQTRLEEGSFVVGDECRLSVDSKRRKRIARNHTATHLLHAALRQVLGEHVIQAGSYVDDSELRFDFSHFERLSRDQLSKIEDFANEVVLQDLEVKTSEMTLPQAKKTGALAHFEEEYQGKDIVRVVSIGHFSRELCGGTHVSRSGEIGMIKIVAEESIAAGTRRIRAVTGDGALYWIRTQDKLVSQLEKTLGNDILAGLDKIQEEKESLEKRISALNTTLLTRKSDELLTRKENLGNVALLVAEAEADSDQLKQLADLLEKKASPAVVLLLSQAGEQVILICKVSKGIGVDAGKIVRALTSKFGGGGGGNRTFAQGGGLKAGSLDKALSEGAQAIRNALG
jgi:alanyl-tRNA synthetase